MLPTEGVLGMPPDVELVGKVGGGGIHRSGNPPRDAHWTGKVN